MLVNNAGIGLLGAFEATPMATVREVFETNTFGVLATTQAVLPQLRARRSGVVVNVTSSATLAPMPMVAVYTASKMAIEGFTASLALELEAFDVRVKLVEPGYGPTTRFASNTGPRLEGLIPEAYAPFAQRIFASFARGRRRCPAGPSTTSLGCSMDCRGMREDDTLGSPGTKASFRPAGRVGRYVILDELGKGGMGVVFSAYDDELDRKVALKLLNPQGSPNAAQSRLIREARTMAKLQHPNVVVVYEAQTVADGVYVAMEFVPGSDLRAWRAAGSRAAAEVVEVFLQAGRGLAAAHAAGIVHRDFKPANVLVGKDGRVRVADFGLALGRVPDEPDGQMPVDSELLSRVTRSGDVVGTPAYMAPEQHRGELATTLSDQFSFCMSLYEALCDRRPFAVDELRRGELPAPSFPGVPTWLRGVIERGLARDPQRRFPSMDALLRALAKNPAARRRHLILAAAAVVGVATAAWGIAASRHGGAAQICGRAVARLQGAWDDAQKARLRQAFLATQASFAEAAFAATAETFDRYAGRWMGAHTEACEATRVRREQPERVLSLRMACLDQRRQSLAATVNVLAAADAATVENAVRAALALPAVDACGNVASLLAQAAPPDDRETRARVEEIRARLSEGRALKNAGKYARALEIADGAARAARPLAYRPLVAETELLRGDLLDESGDFQAAKDALYEAVYAAEVGRSDEVVAEAWIDLLWVVGVRQRQSVEADRIVHMADAALKRQGDPPLLRARYWDYLASTAAHQRRYDEMEELYRRSLALLERTVGADDPGVADVRFNLGTAWLRRRRPADALPVLERALPVYLKVYGTDHPHTARCQLSIAGALAQLGRLDEALERYALALSVREKLSGPNHPSVAVVLAAIGDAHVDKGDPASARPPLERALAIREKAMGPEHADVADSLERLARLEIREARLAQAEDHARRAVGIRDKPEPSPSLLAQSYQRLAEVYLAGGKRSEAIAAIDHALAAYDKAGASDERTASARALRIQAAGNGAARGGP